MGVLALWLAFVVISPNLHPEDDPETPATLEERDRDACRAELVDPLLTEYREAISDGVKDCPPIARSGQSKTRSCRGSTTLIDTGVTRCRGPEQRLVVCPPGSTLHLATKECSDPHDDSSDERGANDEIRQCRERVVVGLACQVHHL